MISVYTTSQILKASHKITELRKATDDKWQLEPSAPSSPPPRLRFRLRQPAAEACDLPLLQQRLQSVPHRLKSDFRHRPLHAQERFSLSVEHERVKQPIPPGILQKSGFSEFASGRRNCLSNPQTRVDSQLWRETPALMTPNFTAIPSKTRCEPKSFGKAAFFCASNTSALTVGIQGTAKLRQQHAGRRRAALHHAVCQATRLLRASRSHGRRRAQASLLRGKGENPRPQAAHKRLGGWDLPNRSLWPPKEPQPANSSPRKRRPSANSQLRAASTARLLLPTCSATPESPTAAQPTAKIGVATLYSRHKRPPQPAAGPWTKPNRPR